MVSPSTRAAVTDAADSTLAWTKWTANKVGNAAWIVTTSALLVGLPLLLSIEGEGALVQQEKEYLAQVRFFAFSRPFVELTFPSFISPELLKRTVLPLLLVLPPLPPFLPDSNDSYVTPLSLYFVQTLLAPLMSQQFYITFAPNLDLTPPPNAI